MFAKHFALAEFLRSDTARRHGINMQPPTVVIESLRALCFYVLDPLRDFIGKPISVTSGYRPHELNRIINGSANSQHLRGEAADIEVPGMLPIEVCEAVMAAKLPYDQLILEYPPNGWCHVSYGPRHRREVLTVQRGQPARVGLHGI